MPCNESRPEFLQHAHAHGKGHQIPCNLPLALRMQQDARASCKAMKGLQYLQQARAPPARVDFALPACGAAARGGGKHPGLGHEVLSLPRANLRTASAYAQFKKRHSHASRACAVRHCKPPNTVSMLRLY